MHIALANLRLAMWLDTSTTRSLVRGQLRFQTLASDLLSFASKRIKGVASWLHAVKAWFNQTAPAFTPCGEIPRFSSASFFLPLYRIQQLRLHERESRNIYRMPKKKRGVEQRVKGNVKVCCEQVIKHYIIYIICLHV